MRIGKNYTPLQLASDVAEIIRTLRITSHRITKIKPFEAHMCRQANTPISNIATSSAPNKLN